MKISRPLTRRAAKELVKILQAEWARNTSEESGAGFVLLRKGLLKEASRIAQWLGKARIGPAEIEEAHRSLLWRYWAVAPRQFVRYLRDR